MNLSAERIIIIWFTAELREIRIVIKIYATIFTLTEWKYANKYDNCDTPFYRNTSCYPKYIWLCTLFSKICKHKWKFALNFTVIMSQNIYTQIVLISLKIIPVLARDSISNVEDARGRRFTKHILRNCSQVNANKPYLMISWHRFR